MGASRQTTDVSEGNGHLGRGEHELAELAFRKALERDATDDAALVGLARALLGLNRKAEAFEVCETAAALHAKRGRPEKAAEVYRRVARYYQDQERAEDRFRVLRRILEITPEGERSKVRVELATALAAAGYTSEAIAEYREEAQLLEAVGVLERIGNRASLKSGPAYNLLLTILEKLSALEPADIETLLKLGRYLLAGKPARAINTLQAALRIDRNNVRALRLLDHAFLAVGQFDKAALTFEEIRILDPSAFSGPAWRDAPAMTPILERIVEIDTLAGRGLLDDARETARALVADVPGSIPARLKLKELHATGGNVDAAMAEVIAAVALALESGDTDHAREVLQDGLRLAPLHPRLRESCVRVAECMHIF